MTEPLCGRDLASVVLVKHGRGSPVERVKITVACDVTNPLYGPNGAAPVFGPQKGATPDVVRELDDALRHLAARLGKQAEANTPGAGAAGGLGFGMLAFFGATLRSGFDIVSDATRLRERLAGADLCITGEGRLDASSLRRQDRGRRRPAVPIDERAVRGAGRRVRGRVRRDAGGAGPRGPRDRPRRDEPRRRRSPRPPTSCRPRR